MTDAFLDVMAFHQKFDVPIQNLPRIPVLNRETLRRRLNCEEWDELRLAYEEDIVKIADAIADLIYVLIGMALEYGIDLPRVWDEVHRANMAKEGGGQRGDGKILKPDGWVSPNVKKCLGSLQSYIDQGS